MLTDEANDQGYICLSELTMDSVEAWNPHEGDDGDSQSPDRKGKAIIADPDWTPSESGGGEDQQHLPAVENHSSVQEEELLQGEANISVKSPIYDQFHVEVAPQRSYNPRYHYTVFCRLSPCIQNKISLKTYDAWKVHRRNFHQESDEDNKKLPTLGAIHDWVNSNGLRPRRSPERPRPIPQLIQPGKISFIVYLERFL